MVYLNSPPQLPQNWGQINPNLNDDHSDPMDISGGISIPDITNWWYQREEMHSSPWTIISDRGLRFASTFWQQACSRLGTDRRMSAACHSQPGRQTERMNASIEQYLRVFMDHQQNDWVKWLPLAEFAANNGVSETTKCTAFDAVQGTDPRMSFAGQPTREQNQPRIDADIFQATIQHIHKCLRVEMRRSQAIQEEVANRGQIPAPNIQEGSQVWLDARHLQTIGPTCKDDWECFGTFYGCSSNIPIRSCS